MKEDILRQIGTIARAFESIANIEFKEMKLNRGQYLFLTRVGENPGIISEHLAELLNIDRTTTARGVKKLVEQGLMQKKNDHENQKIKHLFLTAQGKELQKLIEEENIYSNRLVLEGLTIKQQQELSSLLTVLEQNASNNWQYVKNGGKRKY